MTLRPNDVRFGFGDNWLNFAELIDEGRIVEAECSLQRLCGRDRLDDLRLIDIGSGSGLSSLAARRLGARVHSFDYDDDSVACTAWLRERQRPADTNWSVEQGSILDPSYLAALGTFDIVYSWGVLHHTGALAEALSRAASLVDVQGLFIFALYRKTSLCGAWTLEKRWYAGASPGARAWARRLYISAMKLNDRVHGRDFNAYVTSYAKSRGMSFEHDVHDWLGGYPYESITAVDVAACMDRLGLEPVRSFVTRAGLGLFGSGCDEYVYRRTG